MPMMPIDIVSMVGRGTESRVAEVGLALFTAEGIVDAFILQGTNERTWAVSLSPTRSNSEKVRVSSAARDSGTAT